MFQDLNKIAKGEVSNEILFDKGLISKKSCR